MHVAAAQLASWSFCALHSGLLVYSLPSASVTIFAAADARANPASCFLHSKDWHASSRQTDRSLHDVRGGSQRSVNPGVTCCPVSTVFCALTASWGAARRIAGCAVACAFAQLQSSSPAKPLTSSLVHQHSCSSDFWTVRHATVCKDAALGKCLMINNADCGLIPTLQHARAVPAAAV